MIQLIRSNDPVLMSFAVSVLRDAGIEHTLADANISVIDGSIGAVQSRILVVEDRYDEAVRLLSDAGVAV
jgi:Putative prokaryotic signal transducing protein